MIVVSALVSTGGVFATRFVRSPAQLAADTAEPAPAQLTAPVESRRLAVTEVVRGKVYPGVEYRITPAASSPRITGLYVSAMGVAPGDRIKDGAFVAAVSGRPIFVLRGPVPAYRNLTVGDSGDDVRQLQQAMAELGYRRGSDKRGAFGLGTAKAVASFYRDRGYEPMTTTASPAPTGNAAANGAAGGSQQVQVPSGELVFLPALPATVIDVTGAVGRSVSGPLIKLSTGTMVATGQLSPDKRDLVRKKMAARITDDRSGTTITGTVTSIGAPTSEPLGSTVVSIGGAEPGAADQGAEPSPDGGATPYVPVTVESSKPIPPSMIGADVRIAIDTQVSASKATVVPISAVTTSADGTTQVTIVGAAGKTTPVTVTTGLSAEGMVEIQVLAGDLNPGDRVLVGHQ
ncbi:hypothetical protein HH310_36705 [Actinoplanes sp. TBRC 11911]|uniref:peptidoglycan-binding protein n=1 Tax=Actinoplanes sp. TBRC 11911 TaxID=2729386 RepID=UPI00145C875E|nr:peptidoglycan-binding protein [Actinoplanes sp. TBRC 11911]NMO56702.1 hypothetical protein [Actinoplanes sp. TBRC 11911]